MVNIVERTIQKMRTPVKYLNITRLSEYRRDAHTMVYTSRQGKLLTPDQQMRPESFADCSHWCLPGLPDTWNNQNDLGVQQQPTNEFLSRDSDKMSEDCHSYSSAGNR
ncbi:hypothetical protein J5N97_001154 [Dioscorea zingiberensis]|uniref:Trichome birefringence-like C-terminal domain-containing protein n=1 Tax=Dioscorea zingiberensis TaxID=325984 RepID=A0A9D5BUE8_9LILI|nr:hypothetical protein J5N97_001154 [Dioscorea zingiberensis]